MTVFDLLSASERRRLWRYYQAGIVNALFGYGLFSLLVALQLDVYVAQAVSHVMGVAFNYFTYSRYTFSDRQSSKVSFFLSYVVNYFIGLFFIWAALLVIASPYVAGLVSIVLTSVVNFFILKLIVFRRDRAAPSHP